MMTATITQGHRSDGVSYSGQANRHGRATNAYLISVSPIVFWVVATSSDGWLLMKSIAQELAPHFIRVNSIASRAIRTPTNMSARYTDNAYADLRTLITYTRIGEPDDIAQAAVWLASEAADYVNGATLFVDDAMTLYPGFATGG